MAEQTKDNTPAGDPAEQPGGFDLTSFMKKVAQASFEVDFWKDPETTLNSYKITLDGIDLKKQMISVWKASLQNAIIEVVSERTGADPEQLRDPERRTPEQQREMLRAMQEADERRAEQYKKSAYSQALSILDELQGNYHSANDGDPNYIGIKEQCCLYFFALHDEIPRFGQAPLTDKQKAELIETFYRLDNMYVNEADRYKDDESSEPTLFYRFIEDSVQKGGALPTISKSNLKDITYPIDKATAMLWGLTPGKREALKAESDEDSRKGKEASIYLLFDFESSESSGLQLSRQLTSYDKQVFIAAANLKVHGHDIVTATQIHKAMGGTGRPSAKQRERILKSIETMSMCRVSLDNSSEHELYKKYEAVKATFYLLPTTIVKGYANGHIVDDAIKILEIPKLFEFAVNRRQIAKVPAGALQIPLNKNEETLELADYLLIRIVRMKNAKQNGKPTNTKILLDKVYKKCGIKAKQKQRAPEKIKTILQHYQKQELMRSFVLTSDSIEIHL
jgi:hypothetical protein